MIMSRFAIVTAGLCMSLLLSCAAEVRAYNYRKASGWIVRPEKSQWPVDIFYVGGSKWAADSKAVQADERFYGRVGDFYAPRYESRKDLEKAMKAFLKNKQKPFILVGKKDASDKVLAVSDALSAKHEKRLVATYLLDRKFTLKELLRRYPNIALRDSDSGLVFYARRDLDADLTTRVSSYLHRQPEYSQLRKEYAAQAQSFVDEIGQGLKVRDYRLRLREPRHIRFYTRDIVLHHSGTPTDADITSVDIHSMHLNNGWLGMGYHFSIRKDGTVELGSPLETIGAHSYGNNARTIGVHLSGNFDLARPTRAQLVSLEKLLAYLVKDYGLHFEDNIINGHQFYNDDTACPGEYLQERLPEVRRAAEHYEKEMEKPIKK